jgi:hypothetical protein
MPSQSNPPLVGHPAPPMMGGTDMPNQPKMGGKKSKKTNKSCGGKSRKGRKLSGALKDWNTFVTDVFKKGRAKNPKYSFKQALKDASRMKKKNKTMKN